jgi:hypothetical protein
MIARLLDPEVPIMDQRPTFDSLSSKDHIERLKAIRRPMSCSRLRFAGNRVAPLEFVGQVVHVVHVSIDKAGQERCPRRHDIARNLNDPPPVAGTRSGLKKGLPQL